MIRRRLECRSRFPVSGFLVLVFTVLRRQRFFGKNHLDEKPNESRRKAAVLPWNQTYHSGSKETIRISQRWVQLGKENISVRWKSRAEEDVNDVEVQNAIETGEDHVNLEVDNMLTKDTEEAEEHEELGETKDKAVKPERKKPVKMSNRKICPCLKMEKRSHGEGNGLYMTLIFGGIGNMGT